jgi:flagellar biogenesis protein FliO
MAFLLIKIKKTGYSVKSRARILDRLVLTKDAAVVSVFVYGKVYVLGVTPGGIKKLDEEIYDSLSGDGWFADNKSSTEPKSSDASLENLSSHSVNYKSIRSDADEFPTFGEFLKRVLKRNKQSDSQSNNSQLQEREAETRQSDEK